MDWADKKAQEISYVEHLTGTRHFTAVSVAEALRAEREACAKIALAIDSGRGNEKEIATAIRARA